MSCMYMYTQLHALSYVRGGPIAYFIQIYAFVKGLYIAGYLIITVEANNYCNEPSSKLDNIG